MWHLTASEHYEFYYRKDSLAEKEIDLIIEKQEQCYKEITSTLEVELKEKLKYYLVGSSEEAGICYGDNEPCNGFTKLPNEIYAVYNEDIKCIGYHEDAHIISYMTIQRPPYNFVREGLAMHFDQVWHGIENEKWVKYYYTNNILPKMSLCLDNNTFHKIGEMITYPLSGAFTTFLIHKFGMKTYKKFYKDLEGFITYVFRMHFKNTIAKFEKDFHEYIDEINLSHQDIQNIEAKYKTC